MASDAGRRRLWGLRPSRMQHETRLAEAHPVLRAASADLARGAVSRRDFVRLACLLGVSAPIATAAAFRLSGAPSARAETTGATGGGGGVLRVAMPVHPLGDPALAEWPEPSNITRHQYEYLAITDAENITRPMLARGWAASDDLRVWTFTLREGVRWRDGRTMNADDVAWNLRRWLDPALGSSNASLLGAGADIEVVDDMTLRIHLAAPSLSVPESLYNYPAAIVRPDFSGDPLSDGGGTGPYRLVDHVAGEHARLVREEPSGGYWGASVGRIGPGLLDEIIYAHAEEGGEDGVRAFADGLVDVVHAVGVRDGAAAAEAHGGRLLTRVSAMTGCMRMRVDAPPFDDRRVRRAVQLCCDVAAYAERVFDGRGRGGAHTHVAPIHPEYTGVAAPSRDLDAARRLLAEAGYADGIDLQLLVDDGDGWRARACRLLAEQARPAGVRIDVTTVAPAVYREVWKSTPFGLTQWTHRPLGTMALALGYKSDAAWNETGFADPAFDAALADAEATLDLTVRREAMARVERILQDAAVMAQPVWAPASMLVNERVNGLEPQPTQYHHFNRVHVA